MQQSSDASLSYPAKVPAINVSKEMRTMIFPGSDAHHGSSDATLFSSSLPVLPHQKLTLNDMEHNHQSVDDTISSLEKLHLDVEENGILEDLQNRMIGSLLPDDEDELLAGIVDGFELGGLPNRMDDLEDYDLFGCGGGLELDADQPERLTTDISLLRTSLSDGAVGNGVAHYGIANGVGTVAGEHPLGEHPSRTLFVRNINSNVEDSELRSLFEQYGDIRTLYTACKHRGFVMISYYDIRAARTAMRALQNKPLRRRKLDIHFSIPKDNPSEKDINQGTLVIFNLDPSVSNDDLRQIFGVYGEIKEIRETPYKRNHKFIEFYDVRAAEAALKSLNRIDIAGKRIKLEPSRPGGARRNLMLHLNQELEQDQSWIRHPIASSMGNSPPGNWPKFGSPVDHSPLQTLSGSCGFKSVSPTVGNSLPGLASILHPQPSSSGKVASIGNDRFRDGRVEHILSNGSVNHRTPFQHSQSFPEPRSGQYAGPVSSSGASGSSGSGIETLSGSQFLWGSPKIYPENNNSSTWIGRSLSSNVQSHGFPFSNHNGSFFVPPQHHRHHIGSAPSGVPFEHHFGFYQDSPDTSFMKSAGGVGLAQNDTSFKVNVGKHDAPWAGLAVRGNTSENGTLSSNMMSPSGLGHMFLHSGHFPGLIANSLESFAECWSNRRVESNGNQTDNQKLFQLDLDKIKSGEDRRTTLMIKNIPNKYTSKMLLAAIDEYHKGTYDFLYLPIDFKNKCNVGYAFINMLSPSHIIPFYETFNGKKWEKFNSEKVASLAYARIQGKAALVAHFQNSSLMNEDKRCRPIVFHAESPESGDQIVQDHLSSGSLNIQFHQPNESDPKYPPAILSKDVKGEKPQQAE